MLQMPCLDPVQHCIIQKRLTNKGKDVLLLITNYHQHKGTLNQIIQVKLLKAEVIGITGCPPPLSPYTWKTLDSIPSSFIYDILISCINCR